MWQRAWSGDCPALLLVLPACPSAPSVPSQPWEMLAAPAHTSCENLSANPCPACACCVAKGSAAAAPVPNTLGGGWRCGCDSQVLSVALQSLPWKGVGAEAALMDPAPLAAMAALPRTSVNGS